MYKADDQNDLNVIPIPEINDQLPNDIDPNAPLADKTNDPLHFEADVIGMADFAKRTKEEKLRRKKHREQLKKKREEKKRQREAQKLRRKQSKHINSTLDDDVNTKSIKKKRNRRKGNGHHKHNVDKSTEIPLHPKKIVEDFSDWKLFPASNHPASEVEKTLN